MRPSTTAACLAIIAVAAPLARANVADYAEPPVADATADYDQPDYDTEGPDVAVGEVAPAPVAEVAPVPVEEMAPGPAALTPSESPTDAIAPMDVAEMVRSNCCS